MNIIFIDWKCFNHDDTLRTLEELGHQVILYSHSEYNMPVSQSFVKDFETFIFGKKVDLVFSYNFFPPVAEACHRQNLPYVSVVYDSPYVYLYSYTMIYETNRVYLFDSAWVQELRAGGLKQVQYAVLPAATGRSLPAPSEVPERLRSDLSFVGALYNEAHNFYERLEEHADDTLKGYLEGILSAQSLIYGSDILSPLMTEDLLTQMNRALPLEANSASAEPASYRHLNYVLHRRLTSMERIRYMKLLGQHCSRSDSSIKLFTLDPSASFPGVQNMGIAEYSQEMPLVFRGSRINLNITLRSITTGIPLRCIDIMSCGGFCLSNYQQDFLLDTVEADSGYSAEDPLSTSAFLPDIDYDYFDSADSLLEKADYYLSHEKQRAEIAENGLRKVQTYYSLTAFFQRILTI